ncbi:stress response protein NST1-like, partial [Ceratitis capitata]|uniref:stress response protein NST1-like n=1 Tax=Ceratitis capitata TaxID=7213 RepID=UPI0006188714
ADIYQLHIYKHKYIYHIYIHQHKRINEASIEIKNYNTNKYSRPVTSTTTRPTVDATRLSLSTTPLPLTLSTYTPFSKRSHQTADEHDEPQLSFVSLNLNHDLDSGEEEAKNDEHEHEHDEHDEHEHEHDAFDADDEEVDAGDDKKRTLPVYEGNNNDLHIASKESAEQQLTHDVAQLPDAVDDDDEETANDENNASASHEDGAEETADSKINTVGEDQLKTLPVPAIAAPAEVPTVEVRLKQISQEIEKMAAASNENQRHNLPTAGLLHHENNNNDVDRQSFLSLTDLIRTLRPNNKQIIPQIDSDYSNAMRVLGETSEVVNNEEAHKF